MPNGFPVTSPRPHPLDLTTIPGAQLQPPLPIAIAAAAAAPQLPFAAGLLPRLPSGKGPNHLQVALDSTIGPESHPLDLSIHPPESPATTSPEPCNGDGAPCRAAGPVGDAVAPADVLSSSKTSGSRPAHTQPCAELLNGAGTGGTDGEGSAYQRGCSGANGGGVAEGQQGEVLGARRDGGGWVGTSSNAAVCGACGGGGGSVSQATAAWQGSVCTAAAPAVAHTSCVWGSGAGGDVPPAPPQGAAAGLGAGAEAAPGEEVGAVGPCPLAARPASLLSELMQVAREQLAQQQQQQQAQMQVQVQEGATEPGRVAGGSSGPGGSGRDQPAVEGLAASPLLSGQASVGKPQHPAHNASLTHQFSPAQSPPAPAPALAPPTAAPAQPSAAVPAPPSDRATPITASPSSPAVASPCACTCQGGSSQEQRTSTLLGTGGLGTGEHIGILIDPGPAVGTGLPSRQAAAAVTAATVGHVGSPLAALAAPTAATAAAAAASALSRFGERCSGAVLAAAVASAILDEQMDEVTEVPGGRTAVRQGAGGGGGGRAQPDAVGGGGCGGPADAGAAAAVGSAGSEAGGLGSDAGTGDSAAAERACGGRADMGGITSGAGGGGEALGSGAAVEAAAGTGAPGGAEEGVSASAGPPGDGDAPPRRQQHGCTAPNALPTVELTAASPRAPAPVPTPFADQQVQGCAGGPDDDTGDGPPSAFAGATGALAATTAAAAALAPAAADVVVGSIGARGVASPVHVGAFPRPPVPLGESSSYSRDGYSSDEGDGPARGGAGGRAAAEGGGVGGRRRRRGGGGPVRRSASGRDGVGGGGGRQAADDGTSDDELDEYDDDVDELYGQYEYASPLQVRPGAPGAAAGGPRRGGPGLDTLIRGYGTCFAAAAAPTRAQPAALLTCVSAKSWSILFVAAQCPRPAPHPHPATRFPGPQEYGSVYESATHDDMDEHGDDDDAPPLGRSHTLMRHLAGALQRSRMRASASAANAAANAAAGSIAPGGAVGGLPAAASNGGPGGPGSIAGSGAGGLAAGVPAGAGAGGVAGGVVGGRHGPGTSGVRGGGGGQRQRPAGPPPAASAGRRLLDVMGRTGTQQQLAPQHQQGPQQQQQQQQV